MGDVTKHMHCRHLAISRSITIHNS